MPMNIISKDELVTVTAFSRENRFIQDSIQFLIRADRETVAKVKQVEDLIEPSVLLTKMLSIRKNATRRSWQQERLMMPLKKVLWHTGMLMPRK